MDEEEGWTMVTRRRWKKRRAFPLHLITQESKRAQNQIQPRSRRRSDKRQERLGTKGVSFPRCRYARNARTTAQVAINRIARMQTTGRDGKS